MFLYMTLDAIDGKQARRTGSSSPLGEVRNVAIASQLRLTVLTHTRLVAVRPRLRRHQYRLHRHHQRLGAADWWHQHLLLVLHFGLLQLLLGAVGGVPHPRHGGTLHTHTYTHVCTGIPCALLSVRVAHHETVPPVGCHRRTRPLYGAHLLFPFARRGASIRMLICLLGCAH